MKVEMLSDVYESLKEISETLTELSKQVSALAYCFEIEEQIQMEENDEINHESNDGNKQKILDELNSILENGFKADDVYSKSRLRDVLNKIILKYPE